MVKLTNATALFATLLIAQTSLANPSKIRCIIEPSGINSTDDSPAIIEAFERCGNNGNIVFKNETYFVNSVLTFEGLRNVKIDVYGTLLVRRVIISGGVDKSNFYSGALTSNIG
jgi:hypothetical protein